VKITENQIRRIIRSVLNTSLLSEAKRANNWDEYVTFTAKNIGVGEDEVRAFVDDYIKVLSRFLEDKDNPEITKDPRANTAFLEFMKFMGFKSTMTPSYQDYVKWYKSFNASESGSEVRAAEDGSSAKYLSPVALMNFIFTATEIYDAGLKKAKESSRLAAAEKMSDEEVKKGMRNWIKEKVRNKMMDRRARKTGAKGGAKELSKYEA
jgi:hypothetical protein